MSLEIITVNKGRNFFIRMYKNKLLRPSMAAYVFNHSYLKAQGQMGKNISKTPPETTRQACRKHLKSPLLLTHR
jgi:hypothetical protein